MRWRGSVAEAGGGAGAGGLVLVAGGWGAAGGEDGAGAGGRPPAIAPAPLRVSALGVGAHVLLLLVHGLLLLLHVAVGLLLGERGLLLLHHLLRRVLVGEELDPEGVPFEGHVGVEVGLHHHPVPHPRHLPLHHAGTNTALYSRADPRAVPQDGLKNSAHLVWKKTSSSTKP